MNSLSSCLDLPRAGITHLYYDGQQRHHISEGYFLVLTQHNCPDIWGTGWYYNAVCYEYAHLSSQTSFMSSCEQYSKILSTNIKYFISSHSYPNILHNIRSCSFYPETSLHSLCVSFLHFPLHSSTSLFHYTVFWTREQICSCRTHRRTMPCSRPHASAVSAACVLCSIAPLRNPVSLTSHAWEI